MEISISALDVPKGIHYEGMTYYQEKNQLIWVDIMGQSLMIYDRASGQYEKHSLSCQIGFAIPWDERRLLCGLATGLAFFDQIDHQWSMLADPEPHLSNSRFNDGKLDHKKKLWANTMDGDAQGAVGSLYRCEIGVDDTVNFTTMDTDFVIGNGPTWSRDRQVMYHAETREKSIFSYDFHGETGSISNKRLFFTNDDRTMSPDGMQTDRNDNVWVAMAHGSRLLQISPQGVCINELILSTRFPTSLTFIDEACQELYVTTSQLDGVIDDDLAGSILHVQISS